MERIPTFEVELGTTLSMCYIRLFITENDIRAAQGTGKEKNFMTSWCVRRSIIDQYRLKAAEAYVGARRQAKPLYVSLADFHNTFQRAIPCKPNHQSNPQKDGLGLKLRSPEILVLARVVAMAVITKVTIPTRWARW